MLLLRRVGALLAVVGLGSLPRAAQAVTASQEAAALAAARAWLRNATVNNYAKAVRVAFHDCFDSGCDGCVDLRNPANAGLERAVGELNAIHAAPSSGWSSSISRADWYALVGTAALNEAGSGPGGALEQQPALALVYGRAACSDPQAARQVRSFPSGLGGAAANLALFTGAGFSSAEFVALVGGGHALGGAQQAESGFSGQWLPTPAGQLPNVFTRAYFGELLGGKWTQVACRHASVDPRVRCTAAPGARLQWRGPPFSAAPPGAPAPPLPGFMLNADIALLKDIAFSNAATGRVTARCASSDRATCPDASTATWVRAFAAPDAATTFAQTFASAWGKLVSLGATTPLAAATAHKPRGRRARPRGAHASG